MSSFSVGLGIISVMIIFGIILSGSFMEMSSDPNIKQSYIDQNILPLNFDSLLIELDTNITNKIDTSFADSNLSPGIKKTIHYLTKNVVYGIYMDIYLGQAINEYAPNLYDWMRENMLLVIIGIIILIYPELITLIIICILALILIIKEKWGFKKGRPKNTWRDETKPIEKK